MQTSAIMPGEAMPVFIPEELKAPIDFTRFFTQELPEFTEGVWERIKGYVTGQTELIEARLEAVGLMEDWEEKKTELIELFTCNQFSMIRDRLSEIVNAIEDQTQIDDLLKSLVVAGLEMGNDRIMNRCLDMLSLEKMEAVLTNSRKGFEGAVVAATRLSKLVASIEKHRLNTFGDYLKTGIEETTPWLLQIIHSVINTVLMATFVLEMGREPEGYYEASYMIDIYLKLFSIPIGLLTALVAFFSSPVVACATFAGIVLTSIAAFTIYMKWLKPPPGELPKCTNLSAAAEQGQLEPVIARDALIDKAFDILVARNTGQKEYPIFTGITGVGKTELFKGMALRLQKGDVPEALKGKRVFLVNTAKLLNSPSWSEVNSLEKIRAKLGVKDVNDVILCFDEIHMALKGEANSNLGESLKSLLGSGRETFKYAIGATTKKEFVEYIEKNDAFVGRFEEIAVDPTNEEQTVMILRSIVQRMAPEIEVSDDVLRSIYRASNDCNVPGAQPTSSRRVLAKAIRKKRQAFLGEPTESLRRTAKFELEQTQKALTENELDGVNIDTEDMKDRLKRFEKLETEIAKLDSTIGDQKSEVNKFLQMKEALLKKQINRDKIAHRIRHGLELEQPAYLEDAKKQFLLQHYYVMDAVKDKIKESADKNEFDLTITEDTIVDVIAEILIDLEKNNEKK